VSAAHPGGWILIGRWNVPRGGLGRCGRFDHASRDSPVRHDRNTVVVDGTNPNAATCSSNPADQNFGFNGEWT